MTLLLCLDCAPLSLGGAIFFAFASSQNTDVVFAMYLISNDS